MPAVSRRSRALSVYLLCPALTLILPAAVAQSTTDFITGRAAQQWEQWRQAMTALIERDEQASEQALAELVASEPSALRIALLADRTVRRGNLAGGLLLLEQDAESDALGEAGQQIAELLEVGREQLNEADDGWYFASVGQFPISRANFDALLAQDPDPVALLEFADADPRRHQVLVQLADHPVMGPVVAQLQQTLRQGERLIKADPVRIKQNIERLAGPPRGFENARSRLIESGEFAIPFLLQYLGDSGKQRLHQPILRVLPDVGRPGLNPLVLALQVEDHAVKQYVIRALGQIGYAQAVPYLLKLREQEGLAPEIRQSVESALGALASRGAFPADSASAAQAFFALARAYYDNTPSLAADATLDTANVWYYRDGLLEPVEAPTVIFNEIMAMRASEEALRLDPDLKPALALWIAANFKREAELPADAVDYTRPPDYPSALYFAQSAGAEYCQLALGRAIDDGDAAVALGCIEALHATAGAASLLDDAAGRQPLAEALAFPDRMVRVQAALALGAAKPRDAFGGSQNLLPVLGEALLLHGGARTALVVDPEQASANALAATLSETGWQAVTDASLFNGLQKVRNETAGVDLILLASDLADPSIEQGVQQIRGEFRFAATPLLIITKPGDADRVRAIVRDDPGMAQVTAGVDAEALGLAIANVSKALGAVAITPEIGRELSLRTAAVLRGLAADGNPAFHPSGAQTALLKAFESGDTELKVAVANVLAYVPTPEAQGAIATVALDEQTPQEMRVAMFDALAMAGKNVGHHLPAEQVTALVETVQSATDPVIRGAASRAMGALSLPGNPASELIRQQYQG